MDNYAWCFCTTITKTKIIFLGCFCSQYHNLQVSNLMIYDTYILWGFFMFHFAFNNKS